MLFNKTEKWVLKMGGTSDRVRTSTNELCTKIIYLTGLHKIMQILSSNQKHVRAHNTFNNL